MSPSTLPSIWMSPALSRRPVTVRAALMIEGPACGRVDIGECCAWACGAAAGGACTGAASGGGGTCTGAAAGESILLWRANIFIGCVSRDLCLEEDAKQWHAKC